MFYKRKYLQAKDENERLKSQVHELIHQLNICDDVIHDVDDALQTISPKVKWQSITMMRNRVEAYKEEHTKWLNK